MTPTPPSRRRCSSTLRSNPEMHDRFAGIVQTIWSDTGNYLDHNNRRVLPVENELGGAPVECTKTVFAEFRKLDR